MLLFLFAWRWKWELRDDVRGLQGTLRGLEDQVGRVAGIAQQIAEAKVGEMAPQVRQFNADVSKIHSDLIAQHNAYRKQMEEQKNALAKQGEIVDGLRRTMLSLQSDMTVLDAELETIRMRKDREMTKMAEDDLIHQRRHTLETESNTRQLRRRVVQRDVAKKGAEASSYRRTKLTGR